MFSFLLDNMYHVHKLIYPLISRLRVSLNLIKPHLLSSHTYIYIYASRVENILITINLKTVYNPIHFFLSSGYYCNSSFITGGTFVVLDTAMGFERVDYCIRNANPAVWIWPKGSKMKWTRVKDVYRGRDKTEGKRERDKTGKDRQTDRQTDRQREIGFEKNK